MTTTMVRESPTHMIGAPLGRWFRPLMRTEDQYELGSKVIRATDSQHQ